VTDPEPQPHVNQQDVPKGQVQRSDTAFGEATPKDRDEIVPKPSQDDVGSVSCSGLIRRRVRRRRSRVMRLSRRLIRMT
jgi:hypothetical protein